MTVCAAIIALDIVLPIVLGLMGVFAYGRVSGIPSIAAAVVGLVAWRRRDVARRAKANLNSPRASINARPQAQAG